MTTKSTKPTSIIPEEHLAAIGIVASWWARLEFEVDRTTWRVVGIGDALGACMTAQISSVHGKLKALLAACGERGIEPKIIEQLSSFRGAINGLTEARNRSVHDPRMVNQATNLVHRLQITAQKNLVFDFLPEHIESLWKIANSIEEKLHEFIDIQTTILKSIESLEDQKERMIHKVEVSTKPSGSPEP